MTDADEIEKQIGGEGVTAAATSSGAQGGASNNTNNNSGGGVGLSFIDTSDYNNNQSSEDKRTSLLDVVRESLQRQGKTNMMYRVVVSGGVNRESDSIKVDVGGYYQKFFKQYQAENELITGLLLIYHNTWIHILEASQAVTISYLRELITQGSKNLTKNIRVLNIAEDIPNRFYPFWACRTLESSGGDNEKEVDEALIKGDALIKTISETCVSLMNVGTSLSALSKNDLKPALDDIAEKYKDQIPKPDLLNSLQLSNDIISIEEWNTAFDGHTEWVSENELIWPAPKMILV